jgi:hypothetical protein
MADSDDQNEFSRYEFNDDVSEFDLVDVSNRTRNDLERLGQDEKRASTSCIFRASWTQ